MDSWLCTRGHSAPEEQEAGKKSDSARGGARLLVLKHLKNWIYETLEKEVRPNLAYSLDSTGLMKLPQRPRSWAALPLN
jgi:hypothetical protein